MQLQVPEDLFGTLNFMDIQFPIENGQNKKSRMIGFP